MQNGFYVYEHVRLDTMKPFYVGKGSKSRAYEKRRRNKYWNNVVEKHCYAVNIIAKNLDEELAFLVEIEKIDQVKRLGIILTNMTCGGEGPSGYKLSDAQKEKVSKVHKGKVLSVYTKTKIANARIGKPTNLGKKATEETKKKMSEAHTGKKASEHTIEKLSKIMMQRNLERITCPHCGRTGKVSGMKAWHFDNCKKRS